MWFSILALLPVVLGDACLEGQWACGLVLIDSRLLKVHLKEGILSWGWLLERV